MEYLSTGKLHGHFMHRKRIGKFILREWCLNEVIKEMKRLFYGRIYLIYLPFLILYVDEGIILRINICFKIILSIFKS